VRQFRILAGLSLALAVPAAAHTFGFPTRSAPQACLAIGNTTYRLARTGADVRVRIDASAAAPSLRIELLAAPDAADFVLVDDGTPPACPVGASVRDVSIASAGPSDLVVGFANASAPADYRIYVRSRWFTPETAAALFAAAHRPPQRLADRAPDPSN